MKYIAHRGLTDGPNSSLENCPEQILKSLEEGFDCEVDLRVINDELFLGHDSPDWPINEQFITQPGLWIHCKNLEALEFCQYNIKLNYFWHQGDDYTITSKGFIWVYPGKKLPELSVMVMPEWEDPTLINTIGANCFAICSDYITKITSL